MTSISSYASTASGSTGRRMIVPLYNLSAHNVMTNTILDAGTDAKIAKFHKRSLDLLGVAVLEPIEVWPGGRGTGRGGYVENENRLSVTRNLRKMGSRDSDALHGGNHEALTPTSSAFSLSSAGDSQAHTHEQPVTPTTATTSEFGLSATPTQSSAKKIFGRIFKKKDGTASPSGGENVPAARQSRSPFSMLAPPSSPGSRSSFAARLSRNFETPAAPITSSSEIPKSSSSSRVGRSLGVSSSSTESPSGSSHQHILQPPILGIQPSLSSPCHPPLGRAQKYVWVVKKWQKGSDTGILNGVMKGVGAGVGVLAGVASGGSSGNNGNGGSGFSAKALNFAANKGPVVGEGLEVRFEWVRSTKGHKRRSTTHGRRSTTFGTGSQTSLGVGEAHVQSASSPAGTAGSRKSLGERAARASTLSAQARRSDESRRSVSPAAGITSSGSRRRVTAAAGGSNNRDSRTNSMVSTNASDEHASIIGDKLSTSPKSHVFPDRDVDDGEESDPEDSETPWSCVLVIASTSTSDYDDHDPRHSRIHSNEPGFHVPQSDGLVIDPVTSTPKLPHRISEGSTGSELKTSSALLRLKLGTLAPAPHHPKVVAQLKVPFPLPDVDINRATPIKRIVLPSGAISRSPETENVEGLLLTAEEMKDILCATGFWVVVREGFGGVGKVNRKGDGWRIRA